MRLALLIAVAATLAGPAAGAAAQPRCPARGADIQLSSRSAVVFINARTGAYVGCLRPRGHRRRLATPDDLYSTVDGVVLAGRFVAFAFSHVPECKADCPPGVTGSSYVEVVDLRSGRRVRTDAPMEASALASSGTLVYLSGTELHALDRTGDRVLDSGAIAPESLKASGTTVRWSNGGVARSQDFATR